MKKLSDLVMEDPRIKEVYDYAKAEYDKANLAQHNFEHVIRDLYRVLIIADTERGVNFIILIPAVLLHDIGATTGDYKNHEEAGIPIARSILLKFGYLQEEVEKICHCILVHKGRGMMPETLEAKILYDADVLEKSGLPSIYFSARAQYEFKIPLGTFLNSTSRNREIEVERGFFTKKATEIDSNGLVERLKLDNDIKKVLEMRKDFTVVEDDVW